jgi:toxin YhaV
MPKPSRRNEGGGKRRFLDEEPPLVINGWTIYAYPDFLERLVGLVADFQRTRARDPEGYWTSLPAKLLLAVKRLAFGEIPADPGADRFRLGRTLGAEYRHFRRAKFFHRFRLFFRYHSDARIILFVWLNDEDTLRKAGSRSDPYHIFRDMLERGRPPAEWPDLLAASVPMRMSDIIEGEEEPSR